MVFDFQYLEELGHAEFDDWLSVYAYISYMFFERKEEKSKLNSREATEVYEGYFD